MKLLIAFHSLDRLAGGVDNRLSELECSLPSNITREYLLFKDRVNLPHSGKINIVSALKIPSFILKNKKNLKPITYIFGFLTLFVRILKTRKFIKSNRFTTIFAVDDYFALVMTLATIGIDIKIVTSVRNSWGRLYDNTMVHLLPDFVYKKLLPKLLNRYANSVHCVSHCLADELKTNYDIKNTFCIYNLFCRETIEQLANKFIPFEFEYVINIGHLNDQKNQQDLINAFNIMKKSGYKGKLVIVGDGQNRAMLEELIKSLSIEEDVIFTGKQSNPYPYLKNATLYISSSLYEGLPATLVESLILGVPIVSYDFKCGARELTGNTTELTPEALAKKSSEVLEDRGYYEREIQKGYELMDTYFNREAIVNSWLKVFA
jgi:glycosyltransferase involved in cell wall biosynthesis